MIKEKNVQEDIIISNLHTLNTGCYNSSFSAVSVTAKAPTLRTNAFKILHIMKKAVYPKVAGEVTLSTLPTLRL